MKKMIAFIIFCLCLTCVNAQKVDSVFSKKNKAIITNWNGRGVMFLSGYWEMGKPQLEKKLNKNLVEQIVNFSSSNSYPTGLNEVLSDDSDTAKAHLKMYFVAQFDNTSNGTFHGVEYVLWVPKEENKNLIKGVAWKQDIFIVIPQEAVTITEKLD